MLLIFIANIHLLFLKKKIKRKKKEKRKKGITITNPFQKVLNESKQKPNKI